MLMEPQTRISGRALKVWRIHGALNSIFALLILGGILTLAIIFEWPVWIMAIAVIAMASHTYVFILVMPKLKWKRWRYEVRESEIELQHGVIFTRRTLIPMIRVQHVDTNQGPLLKKYNLATVAISTAATTHEIPALDIEEAEELRFKIGKLARVADEDV
jgi:membrane protein YdbS with pleckstrin-like domain